MGLFLSKRRRPPSRWSSDLPPELAGLILSRLLSDADRLSFRAVCRHWRLAEQQQRALSSALPLIRLDALTFQSLAGGELRRFTEAHLPHARAHMTGCSVDGWLKYEAANDRYGFSTCFLVNPLTGATIDVPGLPAADLGDLSSRTVWSHMIQMTVCSPDLIAAVFSGGRVGFYRPGTPSWTITFDPSDTWCDALAFYHGKLYALDATNEDLFAYEVVDGDGDPSGVAKRAHAAKHVIKDVPSATNPLEEHNPSEKSYLVVANDKLLMVTWRAPYKSDTNFEGDITTIKLKVFEADLEMCQWMEINSLNGQALFISDACSRAIPLPGNNNDQRFQGDRVYFLGFDYPGHLGRTEYPSYGFYDMRSGKISLAFLSGKGNKPMIFQWFFPCM